MSGQSFPSRRALLAGAAGGLAAAATPGWAAAGAPRFLAAARLPSGGYALLGLDAAGAERFRLPLPDRGHAAARHPFRAEAVAFARRPGAFALVIDCAAGALAAELTAPAGRHFYGHGAFTPDGALLLTTESDYEAGDGRIGLWDAAEGYRRVGELPSGGIGPHEIVGLPGRGFAVANGGILTHPALGRAKLNLPTMRPNLALFSLEAGGPTRVVEPPEALRQNSIRHLAARADGTVAAALQWQGAADAAPPLLALLRPGDEALTYLTAPERQQRLANNYAGSVAFSADGATVAITAPRGGRALAFQADSGAFAGTIAHEDICGVAPAADNGGLLFTTGTGLVVRADGTAAAGRHALAFDNHLVAI
ncbi:MAG: DUF1513 domain-containing protein [Pseudomonadota bacterium]